MNFRQARRVTVGFVGAVVLAGCIELPDFEPIAFREGFESGLAAWETGADVPDDPNRPGQKVAWSIGSSNDQAAAGSRSAEFFLDGRQDDGTIWLQRAFDVRPLKQYRVKLSFQLWSESESFNTLAKVAAFAGKAPPVAEEDFDTDDTADLEEGWRTYSYEFDVNALTETEIWVAFGVSAVWETEMTYYIDDVRIDIAER